MVVHLLHLLTDHCRLVILVPLAYCVELQKLVLVLLVLRGRGLLLLGYRSEFGFFGEILNGLVDYFL